MSLCVDEPDLRSRRVADAMVDVVHSFGQLSDNSQTVAALNMTVLAVAAMATAKAVDPHVVIHDLRTDVVHGWVDVTL
ncbi:hypothetical protein BJF88_11020 [Cellulosimicrobium sp. CUA-896]|nr:hypothetical protein BJF88_11020 [Cellulosimicrobium sp. CUA-896]